MSVPAADLPPVAIQISDISSNLHSTVMFTFVMGIYTLVYFGTLYLYSSRTGPQRRIVIASITLLYLLATMELAIQWYLLDWIFVQHGGTRQSTFIATGVFPEFFEAISNTGYIFMAIIADSLVIWRCFFVWNRSLRVISLPLILLFAEIGIAFAAIIIIATAGTRKIHEEAVLLQLFKMLSALFFLSLASSLSATLLIAFRIQAISKEHTASTRSFRHVIEIVVQSAAFYSLALLANGLCTLFPNVTPDNFVIALAFPITGLAPTIMVARVCAGANASTHQSANDHISGLQFQRRSTSHNETQIRTNNIRGTDPESVYPREVKKSMV